MQGDIAHRILKTQFSPVPHSFHLPVVLESVSFWETMPPPLVHTVKRNWNFSWLQDRKSCWAMGATLPLRKARGCYWCPCNISHRELGPWTASRLNAGLAVLCPTHHYLIRKLRPWGCMTGQGHAGAEFLDGEYEPSGQGWTSPMQLALEWELSGL